MKALVLVWLEFRLFVRVLDTLIEFNSSSSGSTIDRLQRRKLGMGKRGEIRPPPTSESFWNNDQ